MDIPLTCMNQCTHHHHKANVIANGPYHPANHPSTRKACPPTLRWPARPNQQNCRTCGLDEKELPSPSRGEIDGTKVEHHPFYRLAIHRSGGSSFKHCFVEGEFDAPIASVCHVPLCTAVGNKGSRFVVYGVVYNLHAMLQRPAATPLPTAPLDVAVVIMRSPGGAPTLKVCAIQSGCTLRMSPSESIVLGSAEWPRCLHCTES
jgi:hypothetical protein